MRSRLRLVLPLTAALLLGACGFQLRTTQALPYESLYVGVSDSSEFGVSLKRAIRASGGTRLASSPRDAVASLTPTGEQREKTILSFNSAGRVREFQLRYRYSYRVHDANGADLIEPVTINMTRDFSFDDASVLAKEQEEALLWRDMQSDLVQQVLRRLAASKPQARAAASQ